MINQWWLFAPLAAGGVVGFFFGRLYPVKMLLDFAWRAGWRASDGGIAPLNAEALAAERWTDDQ